MRLEETCFSLCLLLLLFFPLMTVFTYYHYINSESFCISRVQEET